jgi:drug/metabolite transporter (DMT)-like permease
MIVNFIVKILSQPAGTAVLPTYSSYPTHELVFFRSLISFSISAFILKRKKIALLGNNRKWLFLRGIAGMFALTLFFFTIQKLPIAIASTLQYLAPIFTLLFASILLSEKIKKWQWICILIAFIGVILLGISKSTTANHTFETWKWMGLGIISAAHSGLAYVAVNKLKTTENPLNIVIYFPMISLPIMGIWCLFEFVLPQKEEWIYLLLLGIFTQIAQLLMTKGFMHGDISIVTPFQYLGAIYAIIVGSLFFNEHLPYLSFVGIFLILGGVVVNILVRNIS